MSTNDLSWTKFPKELRGPTFDLFQRELAKYNARQLMPAFSNEDWREKVDDYACVSAAEGEYLEAVRYEVGPLVKDIPSEVDDFIEWFEELLYGCHLTDCFKNVWSDEGHLYSKPIK